MRLIPLNTDSAGNASTILAGYYKYGVATLIGGGFGTSGTCILEIYEEGDSDKHDRRRLRFHHRNPI